MRGRFAVAVILFAGVAGLTGCGAGAAPADVVTGKVTHNGQVVTGEVMFVGADKKEVGSPIALDGTYRVKSPPKGEVQVVVRAVQGPPGGVVRPKDAPKDAPTGGSPGVAPPAKYAQPGNGLKFTVTGGEQRYDIELK